MALKFGIIGHGFMGHEHEKMLMNFDGIEVVAECDIDPTQLQDVTEGVKSYEKAEDLINDPDVEVVLVVANNNQHKKLVIQAAEAGKDVICVYVAIGQKMSTIVSTKNLLDKHGAADYTVVVAASASDSAAMQYIAPFSACAIAEKFMYDYHKDVLIVYDDLSKHAQAYRAISLLLRRPPGREAYPGDVFYLHSRLLERAAKLSDEKGGGSITALPIVETLGNDISAYIPTNVISITDGQIYLAPELFFSGQRPAINVGLSVSRVGGAAQTKAVKKVGGPLRISLAQAREMASFAQFGSDLDENTQLQIARGVILNEVLKQEQFSPWSMAEEVIILYIATTDKMNFLAKEDIDDYYMGFVTFVKANHPDIIDSLMLGETLTDDIKERLDSANEEFKANFLAVHTEYGQEE